MTADSSAPSLTDAAATTFLGASGWVSDRLNLSFQTDHSPVGLRLDELLGLALRENPRRVQLLVSTVLGKHIPTDPSAVYGAGRLLGLLVEDVLTARVRDHQPAGALLLATLTGSRAAGRDLIELCEQQSCHSPRSETVLGFAETATALGHCVAESLHARYLHSTRRAVATVEPLGGFEEEHSHASSHLLLPESPSFFDNSEPLVLVDDELSTGTTALNTIAMLQSLYPRERYVIAALVDLRSPVDRARMSACAIDLGVRIDVVSLASGLLDGAEDLLERGQELLRSQAGAARSARSPLATSAVIRVSSWPAAAREGGRHGFSPADVTAAHTAAAVVAAEIASVITGENVLVLGCEELMYAPLLIATDLRRRVPDTIKVSFSSTTRSPVLAVDAADYAIRTKLEFNAHDDSSGPRFAYNVSESFSDIVLVVDDVGDTEELYCGLLATLGAHGRAVHLVVVPSYTPPARPVPPPPALLPAPLPAPRFGPDFGSYRADEVAWLLTDLSDVELEAPTEEREEAIQHAGAHYAESLPVEFQPSPEYQQLFVDGLATSSRRIALAVGIVTELVLAERGSGAVLVSLARAGTPIGILMRRWAQFAHGVTLSHYAVSIVRGRGIDPVALRYLANHHRPEDIMFVDGWTGKGAITRELSDAVALANRDFGLAEFHRFSPDLAVLADTGGCTSIYGTRDDFLIPSACLNSTVSGLISRTVLNDLIGPNDFHGAKFYVNLATDDVSNDFLDVVTAQFDAIRPDVESQWAIMRDSDRTPTWLGWQAVEKISAEYGIDNVNLVKPGVGETTRVLLRRVPWRILIRPDAVGDLGHVLHLAQERGVQVDYVADLAYSCVGLIHPRFTRGAIGSDGSAVAAGEVG